MEEDTIYREVLAATAIYLDANALVQADLEGSATVPLLQALSGIPLFSSMLGFAEFVKVLGRKTTKQEAAEYMYLCRRVMVQFDQGLIRRVEPVTEQPHFFLEAKRLIGKYGNHGGPDVWHIMAALELARQFPGTIFLTYDAGLARAVKEDGLTTVDGNGMKPEELLVVLKATGRFPGQTEKT